MTTYSQHNRLLELVTPNTSDEIILTHFKGEESLMHGFQFELDVFSSCLDAESLKILGHPVTVKIHDTQSGDRLFNGVVVRIEAGTIDYQSHRHYHLDIAPWLYAFRLVQDCRIFQNLTVPEIFTTLCKELHLTDYDLCGLKNHYSPKNYCVQYNETTYNFIHRLFEETGIYYYCQHREGRHQIHLVDNKTVLPKYSETIQCTNVHHTDKHLWQWESEANFHSSNVHRDIQAIEWPHHQVTAKSNVIALSPGLRFQVLGEKVPLSEYLTLSVYHEAIDKTHLAGLMQNDDKNSPQQSYQNSLICLPDKFTYMPLLLTTKSKIDDVQSAVVVGPKGKTIYTDKQGRIKVQFHWDRKGKNDENSSCWMRTMQMSAGENFGSQFIPRVGDEVVVGYLNSDPDRPFILCSVYNANNREPFPLPENQNKSGIKTQITDSQQTFDRGHELSFDDTPRNEKLQIHSEGDLKIDVLNNLVHTVNGGETISVKGEMLMQVLNGKSDIKAKEIHLRVGNSRIDIDDNGVAIKPAENLNLLVKGGGAFKPVARVGDDHQCPKYTASTPHKGGPILKGSGFVKVNGIPVARVGDSLHCRIEKDQIKSGIDSISVGGKSMAKAGLKAEHGGVITEGSSNVFVGDSKSSTVNLPLMKKTPTQTYWVSLNYQKPDQLKLPNNEINKGVTFTYQDSTQSPIIHGVTLDRYAAGSITIDASDQMQSIQINDTEIIAVNDQPMDDPSDTVKAKNADFKNVLNDDKKPARKKNEATPKSVDKILHATTLYPPMIVNLCDGQPESSYTLTTEQIRHIKAWGNNITIFIHGFHVPFGQYPKQIAAIEMADTVSSVDFTPMMTKMPILKYSAADSDRTIYQDLDMMVKQFPQIQQSPMNLLPSELQEDGSLNGTGAHNWFIHMEDNLNRATGQFDRTDYRKFTRCVHVAWSGDMSDVHYMLSEDNADAAGKNLPDLITQLHNAGIKINIIAHSMGNRVLLKMMDLLGEQGDIDLIEHIFMCEAAVPQNALSNDATKDISVKQNCHFVNATKVAKKISVLYSENDDVLKMEYPIGNMLVDDKNSERQKQVNDYLQAGGTHPFIAEESLIAATIRPALGLKGPDQDTKDQLGDKLISANTSEWIHSHSAIKIPTAEIMEHVYKAYIIGGNGMNEFGLWKK